MKMRIGRTKIVIALLLVVILLVGCAPKESSTGDDGVENESVESGSNLIIGTPYTVDTFVPWQTTSDGDRYIISNIYESLVEHNEQGEYIPGLAESWESKDDLTWELKLRDNSYWHTGNELFNDEEVQVTSEDIKAVFDYHMNEENESVRNQDLTISIDEVEIVDDHTISFTTKEPEALFIHKLSNIFIFPTKAIEEDYDLGSHPVGSGAYKFDKYNTDDQVVLLKNEDYYIEPNIDEVIFKIIPDKSVSAIALQNDEIDISLQVPTTDAEELSKKEDIMLVPNALGWYRYIGFNCKDPLFEDPEIRKAITMAIDMDSAVEAIFGNEFDIKLAERAYGPIPLEFLGANEEEWKKVTTSYDPEGAKDIIESKGWELNSDEIYEKDGKEFSFIIKTPNNDPNRMKVGVMASTELKNIGIDCVAQTSEWATHLSDIQSSNTQMFVMGGGSTPDGLNSLFHSELSANGSHSTGYENKEVDELLDKAFKTIDKDEREKLLTEASVITIEDNVHINGYFEYVQIGMNKRVTDFDKLPSVWFSLTNEFRNVGVAE